MYGIALEKVKVGPPTLNPFEESEFSLSFSWSKGRKKSEDNGYIQICLSNYNTAGNFCAILTSQMWLDLWKGVL